MNNELRPCPFCGSVAVSVIAIETKAYARCEFCDAHASVLIALPLLLAGAPKFSLLKERAIGAWNNRPVEDALRLMVESLEKELETLRGEKPTTPPAPTGRR